MEPELFVVVVVVVVVVSATIVSSAVTLGIVMPISAMKAAPLYRSDTSVWLLPGSVVSHMMAMFSTGETFSLEL